MVIFMKKNLMSDFLTYEKGVLENDHKKILK